MNKDYKLVLTTIILTALVCFFPAFIFVYIMVGIAALIIKYRGY